MQVLGARWRKGLRRSFREAEGSGRITMSPVDDIDAVIDDIYPLYLAVYERSRFNFEKLTKEYFRRLAQSMPDKARFFVWRRDGRIIAFTLVMIQDRDTVYGENLGFDYDVALEIHLYYYLLRDIMTWAMENGYRTFNTGGLSYTLKLHMRARLVPLDLYVRHTDAALNWLLRWALPVLAPVRYEKALRKFPNHDELWA
jgi:predicted N-acyltransferase